MSKHIVIISTLPTTEYHLPGLPTDLEQIEAGLRAHAPDWRFTHLSVRSGRLPALPDDLDGVVLSGSPSSANDSAPWVKDILSMIRQLHKQQTPMLGICFGHQAIAKALGGVVAPRADGWSLGVVPVTWQGAPLAFYAIHTEEVVAPPHGAKVLAQAGTCKIAGFSIGDHILTTQHHPEMPRAFVAAVLDKMSGGESPDPDTLNKARASLAVPVDNSHFMAMATRFFQS